MVEDTGNAISTWLRQGQDKATGAILAILANRVAGGAILGKREKPVYRQPHLLELQVLAF